jgi:outer membrane protein assembly factor BamE (lipoprotein component of BamABCDE complex)
MNQNTLRFWLRLMTIGTLAGVLMVLAGQFWHTSNTPPSQFASETELHQALYGKTAEEVRELLGEPDRIGGAKLIGEKEVWQYDHFYRTPNTQNRSPIYIHFNGGGTVSQIMLFDGRQLK